MKKILLKHKKSFAIIVLMAGMLIGIIIPLTPCYSQNEFPQQSSLCGGYTVNWPAIQEARNFRSDPNNRTQTLAPFLIRVYFHICKCDNGTFPAVTVEQVNNEFNTLLADYASFNVCFLNAGIDSVYNTKLDTNFHADPNDPLHDNPNLFDPYRIPDCINVFYVYEIQGANSASGGGIGGAAIGGIPGTICLVSSGNVGPFSTPSHGQTTSHEVGHCLGLIHTFENCNGGCYEDIDGSNSVSAGDGASDTPADPFCHITDPAPSCFNVSTIIPQVYNGTCQDPKGQQNFSPPYNNLMAYWWTYGYYNLTITSGQFASLTPLLTYNTDLINCESPTNVTVGNGLYSLTSGYDMISALNTLSTSGVVLYSGSAIATLGGETVDLKPGFHAFPSTGGKVLARPSSCTFSPRYSASNLIFDKEMDAFKISCYPNPAKDNVNIVYMLNKDSRINLDIYSTKMQLIKLVYINELQRTGTHQYTFDASNLPSGIYFVKISDGETNAFTKMVLTK
ncbi:MAG: zinc-dependent metalloprotease [Bacteroidia bacterium]